ncbi:Ribosome biogenesis protein Nop16 protein [Dioscorea alata]|uniref:Ribosome biogenesis protein Nop16 protein n=1 Tax=Dioscorea alata TaxID=55571 RepID=A0ACB7V0H4_DIOAL|nr:Ribosome biogenesis protein Nop16 protein [Dioscorea alata]
MAGSRRKSKRSRPKVRVGLPKKKPGVFKPSFSVPEKLLGDGASPAVWDEEGSVIRNYKAFGLVSNPNILSVRARTPQIVQAPSLQVPKPGPPIPVSEFDPIDSGSDLESDDLKFALGKKRRDGKSAPLLPLTKVQRVHVGRLIEKYGDNYQAMFMDTKLNAMQHSVATLQKLCQRYYAPTSRIFINSK